MSRLVVGLKSNTTGITNGAGSDNPSGEEVFIPVA